MTCKKKVEPVSFTVQQKLPTLPQLKPYHLPLPKHQQVVDSSTLRAFQNYFTEFWLKNNLQGGLLVAKNGEIIYEKYLGDLNPDQGTKINKDTPLHIASVSKVITATAILLLINDGQLTLNQKVHSILKEFPYKDITILDLLSHRSGLPNYAYFAESDSIWDKSKALTNQDVLNLIATHKFDLYTEPNTRFQYNNTNYVLLALILEKISKRSYAQAVQEMIFTPLKMKHTFVFNLKRDSMKVQKSYAWNKKPYEWNHLDDVYGDKNIYSTPRDLLKLDQALYGKSIRKTLIDSAYSGYSYENAGIRNYGLGIRMFEWENGKKMYYHNGWWHGNNSSFVRLTQDSVTIIALGNKYHRAYYSAMNLSQLFGDYPLSLPEETEQVDSAQLKNDSVLLKKDSLQK